MGPFISTIVNSKKGPATPIVLHTAQTHAHSLWWLLFQSRLDNASFSDKIIVYYDILKLSVNDAIVRQKGSSGDRKL